MLDVGSGTAGKTGTTSSRTGTTGLSNTSGAPLASSTTGIHDSAVGSSIRSSGNNTSLGSGTTGSGYTQGHHRVDSGHAANEEKPGLLEKVGNKLGLTSSHNTETSSGTHNDGVFDSVNSRR